MDFGQGENVHNVADVEGPSVPNAGFIGDLVERTNENEGHYLLPGDVVKMEISCNGYVAGPATICQDESREEESSNVLCKVQLHPEGGESPTVPAGKKFVISNFFDKDSKPISFTTEPSDPLAPFIDLDKNTGVITLTITILEDMYVNDEGLGPGIYFGEPIYHIEIESSPFLQDVWDQYQSAPVTEGVLYEDNIVPEELVLTLSKLTTELAANEAVDWHPGSNDCVRDLVHPSLFPFVRNESGITDDGKEILKRIDEYVASMSGEGVVDRWGRRFEASTYQWLPSVFRATKEGKVSVESYINNLDVLKYRDLYVALARLFEIFLPRFEKVYAYLRSVSILPEDDADLIDIEREYEPDLESAKLRGSDLRVITKIVDYELLTATDKIEGVWHVEGMSSDHIIMTGIYVLHRDDDFQGGTLDFKRSFLDFEGSYIYLEIAQCRHRRAEEIVEECMRPLGRLETPQGRLIVFPNSHVHKLSTMQRSISDDNDHGGRPSQRRVIVFWVVDPERDVMTTREVPKQQGKMSMEKAREHRLKLMEERKKHKGRLNGERQISLCEH